MLIFQFLRESIGFALQSLKVNLTRSFLTLLGVTIGIFSIISVYTLLDYLEDSVRSTIQSLGDNVVYIQKWPWAPPEGETEYPWWRYINRPEPTLQEMIEIERRSIKAEGASFISTSQVNVAYAGNTMNDLYCMMVSTHFDVVWNLEIAKGRYFSPSESARGSAVVIIGDKIATDLFGNVNPIGQMVKILGRQQMVIGVIKRNGEDVLGNGLDERVLMPINYGKAIIDIKSENLKPIIMVKAREGITADDLCGEMTEILRKLRHLRPLEENDFALNQMSVLQKNFESLFMVIDIAGTIIGLFAILVGAFGIANIMFVSVKERTRIIGIQMSLGAKKRFIMIEFLTESIFLSLIGGVLGLLMIFLFTLIASSAMDLSIGLSFKNIMIGLIISVGTGVIAGYLPARAAAKLNPVEAINTP